MIDPLFWLGLSILLVAVSLTAVLIAALPALQELARAARSIEKLADTLRRELPPTLEAIRLTGLEISDLTDEVTEGVKSAGQVVKQVDQSISGAKNQAQKVQVNTRGVMAGVKAAWSTWNRPTTSGRRSVERLQPSPKTALDLSGDHSSIDDAYSQEVNEAESSLTETRPQKIKEPSPKQYEDFEPEETSEY
ncbi:MAG: DUF948 domain-containing protein [Coleofasciculaceae cyanobacterium]